MRIVLENDKNYCLLRQKFISCSHCRVASPPVKNPKTKTQKRSPSLLPQKPKRSPSTPSIASSVLPHPFGSHPPVLPLPPVLQPQPPPSFLATVLLPPPRPPFSLRVFSSFSRHSLFSLSLRFSPSCSPSLSVHFPSGSPASVTALVLFPRRSLLSSVLLLPSVILVSLESMITSMFFYSMSTSLREFIPIASSSWSGPEGYFAVSYASDFSE
ncbi:hypothetical protein RIF29_29056 [Crotalaria pallida]|uniref:Uncharacterized protein n=1 Tax=Crotalaria pallida TaxID=3830 RepID=A0AAN9I003_CROPI